MTAPSTPPPALSSVLSSAEQWAVLWALADRFVVLRARRDRMQRRGHPTAIDTTRLALIESVVSKLPEFLRVEWAREVERVAS